MDMQEILSKVITSTNEIFQAEAGSVALLEPSGQMLTIKAAVGAGADAVRGLSLPINKGVIGWVATHEKPALIADVSADVRFFADIDKESGFHTKSIMCVPLRADERTMGVIELMNMHPDYLSDNGLKILSVIADHAALAIENARLLAQTQQQSEEQALLFEAMAIVTSDLDLDTVLDAVSRQMVEALKADLCIISRWDRNADQLHVMQSYAGPGLQRPLENASIPHSVLTSQKSLFLSTDSQALLTEESIWLEKFDVQELFLTPLIYRRHTMGLVAIGRVQATTSITKNELRLAETMAAQAAVAIEHARLYDEVTRRLAEAKVLQEVMVAAASSLDFDRVLSGTIEALHRTLGIERLGFFLPSAAGNEIIPHPATIGFTVENNNGLRIPMEGSAIGWVISNGKPLLLPDVKETDHYYELVSDTQSEMCVPVMLGTRVAAVLNAESSRLNTFDHEDLRLFNAIAAELAVALENAQLFENEHRLANQQQALLDVFTDLSGELEPEILFQRIIERAIEVIPNADAGSLIVPNNEMFVYGAVVGFDLQALQSFSFTRKDFLEYQLKGQKVRRLSAEQIIEDAKESFPLDSHQSITEISRIREIKSSLRAGLYAGDEILGSINIDSLTKHNAFTEEDEQTLLLFAGQAAIAIHNARLFEETRAAEANYRDLFDNANDFIFTIDNRFRISSVNKAVLQTTGFDIQEIVGQHITQFVPADQRSRLFKFLKKRLASTSAPATIEVPVRGKDDQETILEITIRISRAGQKPMSIHCIARDITRRRVLEQELRQTEKLSTIGKLVAGVAHELNNPLTSIIGYANLLQDSDLPDSYQEDLAVIFRQAQRARVIVRDLLTFASKIDLETEAVDINEVLQSSLTLTKAHFQNQNIEVTTSFDFGLPITVADPHQLEQVFINLITNAVQALTTVNKPRKLMIKSKQVDNTILISFEDNGPGVPKNIVNRIFDPFFTTKQVGEGTGLGLSICFGIISEHQGRIWAEPSSAGGAIFYIELPIVQVEKPAAVSSIDNDDTALIPASSSLTILAIDDEPPLLNLLSRVLEKLGHSVETAPNGTVGWQKITDYHYDLVICDVLMPDILGPDLYLQTIEKYPYLTQKFIFITGNVVDIDTRLFLEKSKLHWLPKPFLPEDIEQVIADIVAESKTPA